MSIGIRLKHHLVHYLLGKVIKKENGNIVLYKEQAAPNGAEGFFRLTFYDINKSGYKWIGEWVDKTESVVFPTWKINCNRKED